MIHFIEKSGMSLTDTVSNLSLIIQKIEELLDKEGMKNEIIPDLFVDPEYPEWQVIKLIIKIKKEQRFIYRVLKPKIYALIQGTISKELSDKILFKFQAF